MIFAAWPQPYLMNKAGIMTRRQAQLQAQIQNLKARDRSKKEREKRCRKILVGAYTLDQAREKNIYDALVTELSISSS